MGNQLIFWRTCGSVFEFEPYSSSTRISLTAEKLGLSHSTSHFRNLLPPKGSLHKLRLHFLAFDHLPTPPSLHFLRSKCSIFWTTYPLLNAKVICEGSLSLFKILHWLKIRGGWISAWEMPFLFSSRKKKTPSAKGERHVPSPENNSRGFRPNLSTTIAAATVTATYR